MALQPPQLDKALDQNLQHNLRPNVAISKHSPTANNNNAMASQQTNQSVQDQVTAQQLQYAAAGNGTMNIPPRAPGYRPAVIRESRIKDRPYKPMNDSLSIKIELDLEVEVDLYARVKGDVTIGLM